MMRIVTQRTDELGREGRRVLDMTSARRKVPRLIFSNPVHFSYPSGGNPFIVTGGKWRIRGVGAWPVADTTLTLTGSVAYPYVRKTIIGNTVEIGFSNTEPDDADGDWHYQTLCKCEAFGSRYVVTDRMYEGGDIVESAPLSGAP